MARYTGPRARICRRLDFPVFESPKFSSIRKNFPPGQHGATNRSKLSNYGIQLREKQSTQQNSRNKQAGQPYWTESVSEQPARNYTKARQ